MLKLAGSQTQASDKPRPQAPGLLVFWDFQEAAGQGRVSKAGYPYLLREVHGPVARIRDGVFGPYSAYLERGQWFVASRSAVPRLNFTGKHPFTLLAWLKRMRKKDPQNCDLIAGMWDETAKTRQYALFVNLDAGSIARGNQGKDSYGYGDQVNGHISDRGVRRLAIPTPLWPALDARVCNSINGRQSPLRTMATRSDHT